jgi:two-component system, NarL family, invasion response regulator UvrY
LEQGELASSVHPGSGATKLPARVLIADDHAVARAGYRLFLESDPRVAEVGEADSGSATLNALQTGRWDLVLLDIHMPGRSGLDILCDLRGRSPQTRVLIISGLPERLYARIVLRCGASGYLSKDSAPEELLKAVRLVLAGRKYISAQLAQIMAEELDHDEKKSLAERLSAREFQVFCRIARGDRMNAIAHDLSISVKTVGTYRDRILEKMSMQTNADITAWAVRHGVTP